MTILDESALEQQAWTSDYWLGHCETFRVEFVGGETVGYVDEVRWAADDATVEALLVHTLGDTGETVTVPIPYVVDISPRRSAVVCSRRAFEDNARR